MKNFILNIIFFLLISMIPVIAVTFYGDASALFYKSRFYDDLEYNMKLNKFIEIQSNHDERIFKKKLLEANSEEHFDRVIFGSSRVMLVSSNRSLNIGVSGASLEDLLGLYQILREQKITMDSVLIGVDPWMFYSADSRWKSISKFYYTYVKSQEKEHSANRLCQLLNPTYFQESFKKLVSNGIKSPYVFHDSLQISHSGTLMFPKGHIKYGNIVREADKSQVDAKVDAYLSPGNHYKMKEGIKLEKDRIILFEEFVSQLTSKGIAVSVMFPSYHPRVYKEFIDKYKVINHTESIVRDMGDIIAFYGSYNPGHFEITDDMFYDGMHLKESGVKVLLKTPTNITTEAPLSYK